jgi:hypothetical protein
MRKSSTIIIVGGDVRHFQLDKLRAVLGAFSVEWIPTRETDPGSSRFTSRLLRPDTTLVIILCGLLRHQHARDLIRLCRRHSRPYLHLYRSANPTRILEALLGTTARPAPTPIGVEWRGGWL